MKRKAKVPEPLPLPSSHLIALHDAGFTTVDYLNQSVRVTCGEGEPTRLEWLPRLCIALGSRPNEYRVIEWLPKEHPHNVYGFDGYQPQDGHSCGGMCKTVGLALSWFTWREEQKGKR